MRANHHVEIAHGLSQSLKIGAEMSVFFSGIGIPWQHCQPQKKLFDEVL